MKNQKFIYQIVCTFMLVLAIVALPFMKGRTMPTTKASKSKSVEIQKDSPSSSEEKTVLQIAPDLALSPVFQANFMPLLVFCAVLFFVTKEILKPTHVFGSVRLRYFRHLFNHIISPNAPPRV